jgi:tetratricopeptide (TPR) repeat protein
MWLEQQGRMKKAVQHYRAALDSMPDYPVVLNNLAWILAANPRPELRNGPEAVRLATRAVELTGHQEPIILGTLAAAYAEAGQFAKAIETAEAARKLALEIGLPEVAVRNEKLLELYRAGRAAWQVAP